MSVWYSYPNRTLCEVLEEMRKCTKTQNYSYLPGLIEEAQTMASRMESSMNDWRDIREGRDKIREIKTEIRRLEKQAKELEELNEGAVGKSEG